MLAAAETPHSVSSHACCICCAVHKAAQSALHVAHVGMKVGQSASGCRVWTVQGLVVGFVLVAKHGLQQPDAGLRITGCGRLLLLHCKLECNFH
jgi:hypothetical protein